MDVFGSSPAGKLNNLIRVSNQQFENNLSAHRVLIDGNAEKILALTANTGDLKKKSDTQFTLIDVQTEIINALTANSQDLKNKTDTQFTLMDVQSEITNALTANTRDLKNEMKTLETTVLKIKSDFEKIVSMIVKRTG